LRVVAANRDHGDPTALALTATPQATALMPLAPVHMKAVRGGSVVRTLMAATPSVLYAAADEIADFGAPQTSLDVRVTQVSATVGRGFAAEATLTP
jgi:hypothetical protein